MNAPLRHPSSTTLKEMAASGKRARTSRPPSPPKKITTTLHPDEFPPLYAMICDGNCLEPVFANGVKLFFSRSERYRVGDFVALHKRPEFVRPGDHQIIVKQLVLAPPPAFWQPDYVNDTGLKPIVIVDMRNPFRRFYIDPDKLLGIHKCLGIVPPDRLVTGVLSDEEVRTQYPRG